MIEKYVSKLNEEQKRIRTEVQEKVASYILGAFGLVSALAWNDAVKALIDFIFPQSKTGESVALKFLYAVVITLIVVLVTMYLLRLIKKEDKKTE